MPWSSPSAMRLEVTLNDPTTTAEAWQELVVSSQANRLFHTPLWHQLWWRCFGRGRENRMLTVRRHGELTGIAPLLMEDGVVSLVGGEGVSDYQDFVLRAGAERDAMAAFLAYLDAQEWERLELHSIPALSPTIQLLPELARERGYRVAVEVEDVCPRVALPGSWDEYLGLLSKKDRHELRRKLRRLERAADPRFYAVAPTDPLGTALADFLRLHRKSGAEKAAFMTERMEEFFSALIGAFLPLGMLRLYFLEVEGVQVSTALCFDYNGEMSLYNSGYDPAYASLSVGLLLKAFCVREAIQEGKGQFDFLRGAEAYKYDLGGKDLLVYHCLIRRP